MSTSSDRLAAARAAGALWNRLIHLSPVVMGAILLVFGVPLVEISMRRELPTLQISARYFTVVVPVSGALMIFYALRRRWRNRLPESGLLTRTGAGFPR